MHATISYFFPQIALIWKESKHVCIINVWGYTEILPFVLFCFVLLTSDSETNIRMSRGTASMTVASEGLSRPFLKTFAAVYPYPTDRPWVYDGKNA